MSERPGRRGPRALARGFSLLEVLVAFALMSVILGVLFQVFSGGLRLAAQGGEYSVALRLAESRLAMAGVTERLALGEQSGEFDLPGYRWRQFVEPHDWGVGYEHATTAFLVTVEVSWGAQRPRFLTLKTLRLVPPA